MRGFSHFQYQTTNACAFLLINESLNDEKELNLTTNHSSPRAKKYTNYALKTETEGVLSPRSKLVWRMEGLIVRAQQYDLILPTLHPSSLWTIPPIRIYSTLAEIHGTCLCKLKPLQQLVGWNASAYAVLYIIHRKKMDLRKRRIDPCMESKNNQK
jgi:hypothetical protein